MRRVATMIAGLVMVFATVCPAPAQQKHTSSSQSTTRVQAGQQVFQQHCAVCHSILPGATLVGPSLAGEMKVASPARAAAKARDIIMNGKGKMPEQKTKLSPRDLDDLLAYLKTL